MDYICSVCGEKFSTIEELITHLETHKEAESDFQERLNSLKEGITSITDEIDDFNKEFGDRMKIQYDFSFVKNKGDNKYSCDCNCNNRSDDSQLDALGQATKNFYNKILNKPLEKVDTFNKTLREFIDETEKAETADDETKESKRDKELLAFLDWLGSII